jgi:hypothetical protein
VIIDAADGALVVRAETRRPAGEATFPDPGATAVGLSMITSGPAVTFASAMASRKEQCAKLHTPSFTSSVEVINCSARTVIVVDALLDGSDTLVAVIVHCVSVVGAT